MKFYWIIKGQNQVNILQCQFILLQVIESSRTVGHGYSKLLSRICKFMKIL